MACTKLTSHIANDYVVKHEKFCCIRSAGLKTKFLFFIRFFLLSFMMKIAGNEIMRYFLLLAHEKIFTFSCTFLRHKSVIKLLFAAFYSSYGEVSFYFYALKKENNYGKLLRIKSLRNQNACRH
jgi:hypothetical protein